MLSGSNSAECTLRIKLSQTGQECPECGQRFWPVLSEHLTVTVNVVSAALYRKEVPLGWVARVALCNTPVNKQQPPSGSTRLAFIHPLAYIRGKTVAESFDTGKLTHTHAHGQPAGDSLLQSLYSKAGCRTPPLYLDSSTSELNKLQ